MITSSLPLLSFFLLPTTTTTTATTAAGAAYRSATAATVPFPRGTLSLSHDHRRRRLGYSANGSLPGLSPVEEDDDDEVCPVDCVTEFKTDEEFVRHLERSKATGALVVVDFYRPSCGSCKYIEKRFIRLCKQGSPDDGTPIVFLKHNVIDEYDEKSEVADRLRIKVVPMFQFYKDGVMVDSFATRDKERIIAAIQKYTSPEPETTEEEVQE